MKAEQVYWLGSLDNCQLCRSDFIGGRMFDVRIPTYGQWGNVCERCFNAHQCELGTGYGQEYKLQANGKWLKTGG